MRSENVCQQCAANTLDLPPPEVGTLIASQRKLTAIRIFKMSRTVFPFPSALSFCRRAGEWLREKKNHLSAPTPPPPPPGVVFLFPVRARSAVFKRRGAVQPEKPDVRGRSTLVLLINQALHNSPRSFVSRGSGLEAVFLRCDLG